MKKKYINCTFIFIIFISLNIIPIPTIKDFKDSWEFISLIPKNYETIGAIAPFSKQTAKSIIKSVKSKINELDNEKLMFLEVGPGNGALSEYFIKKLEKLKIDYQLDLVELNSELYESLKEKFKDNSKVNIYNNDIIVWQTKNKYHVIVSTLPFNSTFFTSEMVKLIINKYENLVKLDGLVIYVEYIMIGNIYKIFLNNKEKIDYIDKHEILTTFKNKNQTKTELVFKNLPPTYIFSSKITNYSL